MLIHFCSAPVLNKNSILHFFVGRPITFLMTTYWNKIHFFSAYNIVATRFNTYVFIDETMFIYIIYCRRLVVRCLSKRISISSSTFGVYRTTSFTDPTACLSSSTAFSWFSPSTDWNTGWKGKYDVPLNSNHLANSLIEEHHKCITYSSHKKHCTTVRRKKLHACLFKENVDCTMSWVHASRL